ncbi:MAG TPA: hypothetical protein VF913_13520 [Xanthobacteraceae bacterium]
MGELYALESWSEILFVTGILGGGAAWLSGRAIAGTWRPAWHVVGYMALLGAAIRFFHFALFDAELLSPLSYLADTLYVILVGGLAWRVTRAGQMARQYPWLYERTSPVTWRERAEAGEEARQDTEKIG